MPLLSARPVRGRELFSPWHLCGVFASPSLTNALMARLLSGVLPVSDWWLLGWPWVQFTLWGRPVQLAGLRVGHWVFTWGCWWPCSFSPVCFTPMCPPAPWGLSGMLLPGAAMADQPPSSQWGGRWKAWASARVVPCWSPSFVEKLSLMNYLPLGKTI